MKLISKIASILLTGLLIAIVWFNHSASISPAPDVLFKTIKGETISLAALKGKPVLVSFWATDCQNCLEEIPELINLHQQYSSSGLTIIAVAMYYDPPNHVVELATARQLPYAIALDPEAAHAGAFGDVKLTPTSFLIDKNGMIVMRTTGKFDVAALKERLNSS